MSGSNTFKRIKDQGNIIFKSHFLSNLSKVERYEFLQLCHRRNYHKDEFIYHQGDPGTGMYFIEEGRVKLTTQIEESGEKISHTLQSPENFGILAIGYEFRRFTTVQCLTDCTLLGFFKPDFETLKKRQPHIAVKFMETLTIVTMQQLNIAIEELRGVSDPKRIVQLQFDAYYNKDTR